VNANIEYKLRQITIKDKDGNWREHIEVLEEDIPKVAISYSVQECETGRGKVGVARDQ